MYGAVSLQNLYMLHIKFIDLMFVEKVFRKDKFVLKRGIS